MKGDCSEDLILRLLQNIFKNAAVNSGTQIATEGDKKIRRTALNTLAQI